MGNCAELKVGKKLASSLLIFRSSISDSDIWEDTNSSRMLFGIFISIDAGKSLAFLQSDSDTLATLNLPFLSLWNGPLSG